MILRGHASKLLDENGNYSYVGLLCKKLGYEDRELLNKYSPLDLRKPNLLFYKETGAVRTDTYLLIIANNYDGNVEAVLQRMGYSLEDLLA